MSGQCLDVRIKEEFSDSEDDDATIKYTSNGSFKISNSKYTPVVTDYDLKSEVEDEIVSNELGSNLSASCGGPSKMSPVQIINRNIKMELKEGESLNTVPVQMIFVDCGDDASNNVEASFSLLDNVSRNNLDAYNVLNTSVQSFEIKIKEELYNPDENGHSKSIDNDGVAVSDTKCEPERVEDVLKCEVEEETITSEQGIMLADSHTGDLRYLDCTEEFNDREDEPVCRWDPICEGDCDRNEELSCEKALRSLKPYKCPDCDKCYAYNSSLGVHRRAVHYKLKPHECPDCEMSFSKTSHLKQHQAGRHLNLKPYTCLECDRGFSRKETLKNHQVSQHLKVKTHECPDCKKNYSRKEHLNYHRMSKHLNVKPHKCPHCDKCFVNKIILRGHQRVVHDKIKPHKCLDCDKSYYNKQELHYHRNSKHLNIKPFTCPTCDKGFLLNNLLRRHQDAVHGKKHKCEYCGKSYNGKRSLELHVVSQHFKTMPYKCPLCNKGFCAKEELTRHHMSQHLQAKPYQCTDCHKFFVTKATLKRHRTNHHQ